MATMQKCPGRNGSVRYRVKVRLPGRPAKSRTFLTETSARD